MDRHIPTLINSLFSPNLTGVFEEFTSTAIRESGLCAYCYSPTELIIPYKEVIKDTFKYRGLFHSQHNFCPVCAFSLTYTHFRQFNWLFSPGYTRDFKHQEVWNVLLNPDLGIPYVLTLTTSHKKHQLIFAEGNYATTPRRKVVFDEQLVVFDLENDGQLAGCIHYLYNELNQPKAAILSAEYHVAKLSDDQYADLLACEAVLSPYRGSLLLTMLCTFVQKEQKEVVSNE